MKFRRDRPPCKLVTDWRASTHQSVEVRCRPVACRNAVFSIKRLGFISCSIERNAFVWCEINRTIVIFDLKYHLVTSLIVIDCSSKRTLVDINLYFLSLQERSTQLCLFIRNPAKYDPQRRWLQLAYRTGSKVGLGPQRLSRLTLSQRSQRSHTFRAFDPTSRVLAGQTLEQPKCRTPWFEAHIPALSLFPPSTRSGHGTSDTGLNKVVRSWRELS